jgi:uncharacterized membrane protein YGL010W
MKKPRWLKNWLDRHQNRMSFALHVVGIPMTVVAVGFWMAQWWWTGCALFAGGYLLQFVGHAIEGNDAGELILVKKMLGMPYIAVVPRSNQRTADENA